MDRSFRSSRPSIKPSSEAAPAADPIERTWALSLEQAGAALTILELDDELTVLWDAPVRTTALRWGM